RSHNAPQTVVPVLNHTRARTQERFRYLAAPVVHQRVVVDAPRHRCRAQLANDPPSIGIVDEGLRESGVLRIHDGGEPTLLIVAERVPFTGQAANCLESTPIGVQVLGSCARVGAKQRGVAQRDTSAIQVVGVGKHVQLPRIATTQNRELWVDGGIGRVAWATRATRNWPGAILRTSPPHALIPHNHAANKGGCGVETTPQPPSSARPTGALANVCFPPTDPTPRRRRSPPPPPRSAARVGSRGRRCGGCTTRRASGSFRRSRRRRS